MGPHPTSHPKTRGRAWGNVTHFVRDGRFERAIAQPQRVDSGTRFTANKTPGSSIVM